MEMSVSFVSTHISTIGHRYHLLLVGDCTRFNWFYPLKCKSEVWQVFTEFMLMIEKLVNRKIKSFQSYNEGEFLALSEFFRKNGIIYRRSCPLAHQQMGAIERWHSHVVDSGLTLLNQVELLFSFWRFALATATFTYNRTSTSSLGGSSPYEKLFRQVPNVKDLRVFGCVVYLNIRPFNKRNFSNRSKEHIFIGYSANTNGYLCYDPDSGKILISRDVIFLESDFSASSRLHNSEDIRLIDPIPNISPIRLVESLVIPTACNDTFDDRRDEGYLNDSASCNDLATVPAIPS